MIINTKFVARTEEKITKLYINGKMYGFNLKIEGEREEVFAINLMV